MKISQWLKHATDELADDMLPSPRLDAEIILSHTVRHPRTYLHAHGDEDLSMRTQDIANARLELRKDRVPVAYIIGHKEFYGRRFVVSPAVLIPRPESEELLSALKQILPNTTALPGVAKKRLVDIGTGSGCLGVTAKLEFPELEVALVDNSRHALAVAEKNARLLEADVELFVSDLMLDYPYSPDIIVANLPYVDKVWDQSPELASEPPEALYADDGGLAIIKRCIEQAAGRSKPAAYLLLEADPRQLDDITRFGQKHGFTERIRGEFIVVLQRD